MMIQMMIKFQELEQEMLEKVQNNPRNLTRLRLSQLQKET